MPSLHDLAIGAAVMVGAWIYWGTLLFLSPISEQHL